MLISACLLIAGICLIFFIKIKWNVVPCALLVVAIVLLVSGNFFRFPLTYQVLSVSSIAFLYCAVVFVFSKKESRELVMKDYNTKQEKWMSWTAFSCGVVSLIASYYSIFMLSGLIMDSLSRQNHKDAINYVTTISILFLVGGMVAMCNWRSDKVLPSFAAVLAFMFPITNENAIYFEEVIRYQNILVFCMVAFAVFF